MSEELNLEKVLINVRAEIFSVWGESTESTRHRSERDGGMTRCQIELSRHPRKSAR